MKSLVRVTDASTEPVTTAEAKAFLRVDSDSEDTLLGTLITAARQRVEDYTGLALISQTWKLVQSDWPRASWYSQLADPMAGRVIALDRSPLISVESVKYYPASGAAQATLSAATYYHALTGPTPGLVVLKSDQSWPDLYDRPDAVEVNFTAGYANAAAVPTTLRQAVLLLVAEMYELRNTINVGNITSELPTIKALLDSYRVGGWAA